MDAGGAEDGDEVSLGTVAGAAGAGAAGAGAAGAGVADKDSADGFGAGVTGPGPAGCFGPGGSEIDGDDFTGWGGLTENTGPPLGVPGAGWLLPLMTCGPSGCVCGGRTPWNCLGGWGTLAGYLLMFDPATRSPDTTGLRGRTGSGLGASTWAPRKVMKRPSVR